MEREGVAFSSRTRTQTWRQARLYGQPSTTTECCEYSYARLTPNTTTLPPIINTQHTALVGAHKHWHIRANTGTYAQTLAHTRKHWHIRANTGTYAQTTLLRVFLGWWLFFLLICRLSKGTYAYGSGRPACGVQRATQETFKERGGGTQSQQESMRERASEMARGREKMRARGAGRLWAAADLQLTLQQASAHPHTHTAKVAMPTHMHGCPSSARPYTNTYNTEGAYTQTHTLQPSHPYLRRPCAPPPPLSGAGWYLLEIAAGTGLFGLIFGETHDLAFWLHSSAFLVHCPLVPGPF
jgi:hypothetical protein